VTRTAPSAAALAAAPLIVVREEPLNAESPLAQQVGHITPVERFYIRSHFGLDQAPSAAGYRLEVGGAVAQPLSLSLDDVLNLPRRSLISTMECAGNGRKYLEPRVPGEQWDVGAVSTAEWTGASLSDVLEKAIVEPDAVEVLFAGVDRGPSPVDQAPIAFERSLPMEQARHSDILLCYAMNGAPLTDPHGAPLRLVVPGWYGMASVKWLSSIQVLRQPFEGAYQKARYVIDRGDGAPPEPLGAIRMRALITQPPGGVEVAREGLVLRGFAWSGSSPVAAVEISDDDGRTWQPADLADPVSPLAWRPWQLQWVPSASGPVTLMARARDERGLAQPLDPDWNVHGYGNNAVQRVQVTVSD
jgi:DMSO/TMAO reductase YedYZ molybdopterin-dependent catalytic subunit